MVATQALPISDLDNVNTVVTAPRRFRPTVVGDDEVTEVTRKPAGEEADDGAIPIRDEDVDELVTASTLERELDRRLSEMTEEVDGRIRHERLDLIGRITARRKEIDELRRTTEFHDLSLMEIRQVDLLAANTSLTAAHEEIGRLGRRTKNLEYYQKRILDGLQAKNAMPVRQDKQPVASVRSPLVVAGILAASAAGIAISLLLT
jgi:hypothetical protein